ncbi:MAG TPA: YggS family pyridoxal phosphate-dependent enzyme [Streptosporangiaceae bacterium]
MSEQYRSGHDQPDPGRSERRRAELADGLSEVWARIETACAAAGRSRDEITLIAVTKTWPASDVRLLYELGQRDFGENRDQEAAPKAAACADLDLTWHFVGQLQTNKVASVTRYADVIHSVDRLRLVHALGRAAQRRPRPLTALIQVSLEGPDGDPDRGGAAPGAVTGLAEAIVAENDPGAGAARRAPDATGLRLGGVMAVAPLGAPVARAFAGLDAAAAAVRAVQPAATMISAGMSGDLEAAVEAGATHLRIGTALLGDRRARVM